MRSPQQAIWLDSRELADLPFAQAAEAWLSTRTPYISPKTFHEYELNIKTLGRSFLELRLRDIDADLIRNYQQMRLTVKRDAVALALLPEGDLRNQTGLGRIAIKGFAAGRQPVIDMLESGIPAAIVIAKIKTASCHFDVSVRKIQEMRQAKVPDSVVLAMVRKGCS